MKLKKTKRTKKQNRNGLRDAENKLVVLGVGCGSGGPDAPFLKKEWVGLPWWLSGKEPTCRCRRHRFDPWSGKIPHAVEQLSPRATITETVLESPGTTASEAHTP